ncbi:glutathione S-transferase family protein [Pelagibacterium xiamenense]|uniref:glutathione S-transferase family protein n=1 Tax=Pelagibacterium xiamenense TaxID=2901140 RepID=UPI001E292DAF|nr:glutathione S-transferase family protein [Pelagibacterium xiamenense]MCD7058644.1 glutathione S-transferase family protein [Pelagibacterium xiamenense]
MKPIVYHIPVCPFSQRLEILLALKGQTHAVEFRVVDITKPRDPALLEKTRGTTSLPVLEMPDGRILKESLVILDYLDEALPGPPVRRTDPYEHAIERMLIALEGPFTGAGYMLVMNQDRAERAKKRERLLELYARIDDCLVAYGGTQREGGDFLFDAFGLAETVFAPVFARFWFLEYYEGFDLPHDPRFERVRRWRTACLGHHAAQQVSREEIVKLYYDYALGMGNGALPAGREISSFAMRPHWRDRPWPPADKYGPPATDVELGLAG